jgi:TRAP-type uncharacterized transport system fused permease subunit
MFLLFFSVLSAMTPPVAVAAYAASSIADANPLAVACTAVRLSLVLFILPFAFVSGPGLIAQASPGEVTLAIGMAIPGVFALAVASEGYLGGALSWWQRVAAATAGFCLLFPAVIGGMVGELI